MQRACARVIVCDSRCVREQERRSCRVAERRGRREGDRQATRRTRELLRHQNGRKDGALFNEPRHVFFSPLSSLLFFVVSPTRLHRLHRFSLCRNLHPRSTRWRFQLQTEVDSVFFVGGTFCKCLMRVRLAGSLLSVFRLRSSTFHCRVLPLV